MDPVDPGKLSPRLLVWMPADGRRPDALPIHQCVVAYASDMTRGFATGRIFSRDGRLVISVVQEGLIRPLSV